jgi:two-component system, cell cycle response regulator DivK
MLSNIHGVPEPDRKPAPLPAPARSAPGYMNGANHGPAPVPDSGLPPRKRTTPRSEPKRILIVEDNELSLKLLRDVLEFHGYTVISTNLGAAALDLARKHRPHLILLDIQLPDIPGTEAAGRLKADEQVRAIPVVAVTAFAMSGDRAKILGSGCDDYVTKPINILDFLALVGRYTKEAATNAEAHSSST